MQALAAIAAVVASLVGHPTPVTCASAEQWASDPAVIADVSLYGFTPAAYTRLGAGSPEIAVGPFGCQYLSLLFEAPGANDARTRFFEGEALLLLVHETQHAAGWAAEAEAECRAVALYPSVVATLGLSPAAAQGLAAGAAAYHASMPSYYRTGCEQPTFVTEVPTDAASGSRETGDVCEQDLQLRRMCRGQVRIGSSVDGVTSPLALVRSRKADNVVGAPLTR
jgi:hypothetical protein